MKNFWKCLKTDFWSIWGETGVVCIMIIFIYVVGGSELWFPMRADPEAYGITSKIVASGAAVTLVVIEI